MHSLLASVLWLLVILAAIPVSLWLLKRSPVGASLSGQQGHLHIISSLALGAGQRLVTVEVREGEDRRWLVLGVTAQNIQTVHSMTAPPLAASDSSAQAKGFGGLMQHLRSTSHD